MTWWQLLRRHPIRFIRYTIVASRTINAGLRDKVPDQVILDQIAALQREALG